MALLLGAAAVVSLRGAVFWDWRGAEPGRAPRAPSIFSPGVSLMRIDRPTRLRGMSTSMTLTLTTSPALTASRGSLMNFSESAEMCTKPS
ncbi:hypothetical protein D3C84_1083460 [compost metagenome]